MNYIKKCLLCFRVIENDGRAVRSNYCYRCRVYRKREYNQFRSEIIRTHGQNGWNNYLILRDLFAKNFNVGVTCREFTTVELVQLGFWFPNGISQKGRSTPLIISSGKFQIANFIIQHSEDGHEVFITQLAI